MNGIVNLLNQPSPRQDLTTPSAPFTQAAVATIGMHRLKIASIICTVMSALSIVKFSAAEANKQKLSLIARAITNASRQYAVKVFSHAIPVC